jgi:spore photoproduct lyase
MYDVDLSVSHFASVPNTNNNESESFPFPSTYTFRPRRVVFYPKALDYPLGKNLYERFQREGIRIEMTDSRNRVRTIAGNPRQVFLEAKRTLVVGVRNDLRFATCKPSADYQLPLTSSCPGQCEYCYLHTTLGARPYVRIYVNLEEILNQADQLIAQKAPDTTTFEGAATSDPIPTEKYSQALQHTINHFAGQELGRFRFVTKFTEVENLLDLDHRGHTTWRFSLNTERIIKQYEVGTPRLADRLQAAKRVAAAGYPLGFLIAPIFLYPEWPAEYADLLHQIARSLPGVAPTFELITHRFTPRAKKQILELWPATALPLEEEQRQFKYGQFGYGKYIYPKEKMPDVKSFFEDKIQALFGAKLVSYFV